MRPGKKRDIQNQPGYSRALPRPPKSKKDVKERQKAHRLDRYANFSDATTDRLSFLSVDDLDRYGTVRSPTEMARFTEFRKKPNLDRYSSFSTVQTARDRGRKREAPKPGANGWEYPTELLGVRVLPDVPGEPTGVRVLPDALTITKDVKGGPLKMERISTPEKRADSVWSNGRRHDSMATAVLPGKETKSDFNMPKNNATHPPSPLGTIPSYLLPPLGGMFPARSRGDPSRCSSSEEVFANDLSRREIAAVSEKKSVLPLLQATVPSSPAKPQRLPAEGELRHQLARPTPLSPRTASAVGPLSPSCLVEDTHFTSDKGNTPISLPAKQVMPGRSLAMGRSLHPFLAQQLAAYRVPCFRERIYSLLVDGCTRCQPCSPETNRVRIRCPLPEQHQNTQYTARGQTQQFFRPLQQPPRNSVNRCVLPPHSVAANQAYFRSRKMGSTQTEPEVPPVRPAEPESLPLSKETQASSCTERHENVHTTERETVRCVNVIGSEAPPMKDEKATLPPSITQRNSCPASINEAERTIRPRARGAVSIVPLGTPAVTSSTTLLSSETSTESSSEDSDSVTLETDSTSTSTSTPVVAGHPEQSVAPSALSNANTDTNEPPVLAKKEEVISLDMKSRKNPTTRRYGRSKPKSLLAKSDFRSERDIACKAIPINVPRPISLRDVATSTCLSPAPRVFITTPELDLPPSPIPSPSPPIARHPFFSPPAPSQPTRPNVGHPGELYMYQPPSPPLVEEGMHAKPESAECELKQQLPVSESGVAMHLCVAINLVLFSALVGIVIAYLLGSESFRKARSM